MIVCLTHKLFRIYFFFGQFYGDRWPDGLTMITCDYLWDFHLYFCPAAFFNFIFLLLFLSNFLLSFFFFFFRFLANLFGEIFFLIHRQILFIEKKMYYTRLVHPYASSVSPILWPYQRIIIKLNRHSETT